MYVIVLRTVPLYCASSRPVDPANSHAPHTHGRERANDDHHQSTNTVTVSTRLVAPHNAHLIRFSQEPRTSTSTFCSVLFEHQAASHPATNTTPLQPQPSRGDPCSRAVCLDVMDLFPSPTYTYSYTNTPYMHSISTNIHWHTKILLATTST